MFVSEKAAPLQHLTIFLAKPGLTEPVSLIDKLGTLAPFSVADEDGFLGTLYVENRGANPPKWSRFFATQIERIQFGLVSSASAVFHVVVSERTFLLTFGQGRYLLKPDCCEDRFGLRVTLNSIGENRVRSIDKSTLDTLGLHSRVQTSKESAPSEFGLDVERDLLRAITGTPIDQSLGHTLSGLDSLHANVRVSLLTLRNLLRRYLDQFEKETFKETFPWVDHISAIKSPTLNERLDALMLKAIIENKSDRCWLTIPEPVEWSRIAGFKYRKGTRFPLHHDIGIETFLQDQGIDRAHLTIDQVVGRDILALDGEGTLQYKWSAYRCIYCETEEDGETYLLSSGRWYKVSSDFVGKVNEDFASIPRLEWTLPDYKDASEAAYNARVANYDASRFALMDQKFVMIGGGQSKIEFCDLLSNENDLIHVKRYGGAGVLSHLFNQGLVSGESFVSEPDFRDKLNEHLPDRQRLSDTEIRPDAAAYRVVYAIVSRESGSALTLPFFSRLSLRHAIRILRGGFGYRVALARIAMDEGYSKTKTYR